MRSALLATVVALVAACGGKAKDAAEPGQDSSCCCATADGREVLGDTVCQDAGGSCEPVETCEAADPGDEPAGSADPDDY